MLVWEESVGNIGSAGVFLASLVPARGEAVESEESGCR